MNIENPCQHHPGIASTQNNLCQECNWVNSGIIVCRMQFPKGLFQKNRSFTIVSSDDINYPKLYELLNDHALSRCEPQSSFKLVKIESEMETVLDSQNKLSPIPSGIYIASFTECA